MEQNANESIVLRLIGDFYSVDDVIKPALIVCLCSLKVKRFVMSSEVLVQLYFR